MRPSRLARVLGFDGRAQRRVGAAGSHQVALARLAAQPLRTGEHLAGPREQGSFRIQVHLRRSPPGERARSWLALPPVPDDELTPGARFAGA